MDSRTEVTNAAHKIQALFEDQETVFKVLRSKIEYRGNVNAFATTINSTKDKGKVGQPPSPT